MLIENKSQKIHSYLPRMIVLVFWHKTVVILPKLEDVFYKLYQNKVHLKSIRRDLSVFSGICNLF